MAKLARNARTRRNSLVSRLPGTALFLAGVVVIAVIVFVLPVHIGTNSLALADEGVASAVSTDRITLPGIVGGGIGADATNYVPNELIVGYLDASDVESGRASAATMNDSQISSLTVPVRAVAATAIQKYKGTAVATMDDGSSGLYDFPNAAALQSAQTALAGVKGIRYVTRNAIAQSSSAGAPTPVSVTAQTVTAPKAAANTYVPNDYYEFYQWNLRAIGYETAGTPAATTPCVVEFDTGVDYKQQDLVGQVYKGIDEVGENASKVITDSDPMDENGHGTFVAGIISALTNNKVGIAGISPGTKILAVRVLNAAASGTDYGISLGINWATKQTSAACGGETPKIYNLSLTFGSAYPAATEYALAQAHAKGVLIIAAAGNDNAARPEFPAAVKSNGDKTDAYGVAATDINNKRATFSDYSDAANPCVTLSAKTCVNATYKPYFGDWVPVAAPGVNITSTYWTKSNPTSSYWTWQGTSFSAPVIAAVAARVWALHPTWTGDQVMKQIIVTGTKTTGFVDATPLVNLQKALGK